MTPTIASTWQQDDERNVDYYSGLLKAHGFDVKSLDWGSRESQELRFRVLSEVAPVAGTRVLDVGCGLGDLLGWLRAAKIDIDYTGIDITPGMVAAAQQRFPGARFVSGNILQIPEATLGTFDYALLSGVFTYRQHDAPAFMRAMIQKMFSLAERGVAFNSLSTWAPQKDPGEFYADPVLTLEWCRELTPWVTLRHDYHPRDFTIYLYKRR